MPGSERRRGRWSALAAVLAVVAVAGCGGVIAGAPSTTSAPVEAASGSTDAPLAAPPLWVGLVTDASGFQFPGSWSYRAGQGLSDVHTQLGLDVGALTPDSSDGYEASLEQLASSGYGVVVASSSSLSDAVHAVALRHPNVRFVVLGASASSPQLGSLPNVSGVVFSSEESGYAAGAAAAQLEISKGVVGLKPGAPVIGLISGSHGDAADAFVAGFQAGVRSVSSATSVLTTFTDDALNEAPCANAAKAQIADGADIVFPVAGACSVGAMDVAQKAGVWSIGWNLTSVDGYGSRVLGSLGERSDVALLEAVRAYVAGTLAGGADLDVGLADGALRFDDVSGSVPPAVLGALDRAASSVEAGVVDPPTTPTGITDPPAPPETTIAATTDPPLGTEDTAILSTVPVDVGAGPVAATIIAPGASTDEVATTETVEQPPPAPTTDTTAAATMAG